MDEEGGGLEKGTNQGKGIRDKAIGQGAVNG